MEWIILTLVVFIGGFVVFVVLFRPSSGTPEQHDRTTPKWTPAEESVPATAVTKDAYQSLPSIDKPKSSRLSAAEVLARAKDLFSRGAQWPAIWAELNPSSDPTLQQLLVDLRNDGLQFAPRDGLRRIELAAEELAPVADADAVTVLKKVLGQADLLDRFK